MATARSKNKTVVLLFQLLQFNFSLRFGSSFSFLCVFAFAFMWTPLNRQMSLLGSETPYILYVITLTGAG